MSMALAHFSIGATFVIIGLILTRRYTSPRLPLAIVAGGLWGMGPDVHWVIPHAGLSERIAAFHSTHWADFFAFHYTLDVVDPANSVATTAHCLALFVLATAVLSVVQYWDVGVHSPE